MANTTKSAKRFVKFDVRRLVFTALMAALSIVLSELQIVLPIMPSFIKFDFSDAPAVLASLTMGPVSGISVSLIKNIFGCFTTKTGCIGELSNFILSASLVLPAGIIAHKSPKLSRAVIGCAIGAVVSAGMGFVSNYLIIYPLYDAMVMPMDVIIGMYKAILPSVDSLADCLWIFNVPFTFVKGVVAAVLSLVLYKKLRPIFYGFYRQPTV